MQKKGAVMVEFAIILPFFLLILMVIIYGSMFLFDYTRLGDMTRVVTRYAALNIDKENNLNEEVQKIKDYAKERLDTDRLLLYKVDSNLNIKIIQIMDEDNVEVEIKATKKDNIPVIIDDMLPETISEKLKMCIE